MKLSLPVQQIRVGLQFGAGVQPVGRLAQHERRIYFEYDAAFLERGLELSPFHLPLRSGLFSFEDGLFENLPGVFNDSLPDGWGRLLVDRQARANGLLPADLTPLARLALVGRLGMGALVYEPDCSDEGVATEIRLDTLAQQAQQVLEGTADAVIGQLLSLNGSSAGARPKALIGLDAGRHTLLHGVQDLPEGWEHWLVKFSNSQDGADAGAVEFVYALLAARAGVDVPPVHLFPAGRGAGYFAIRRFDRMGQTRLHMHTACGLLHSDYRTPSLDYEDLLALGGQLTRDMREVEKLFRLAVFNVLAHNRDDHAKNFSFLMDAQGRWRVAPAYDLTFSSGPGGEQSTLVLGEGRAPGQGHLLKLGEVAGLSAQRSRQIIDQTRAALVQWPALARQHGVSAGNIALIKARIAALAPA